MSNLKIRIACLFFTLLFLLSSSVSSVLALVNYSYDQNGNMVSDGQYCYTYNDANQVSKVKKCSSGQTVSEYLYDYTGRRIVKKEYENGILKQTVYSPDKNYETKKLANNSTQNTSYYYANDELIARKNPDSSKVFYLNDHLNSTNILTDATGKLIEETTYYPYGDIRSGGTNSKYLYTGQEKDLLTGLNYYGARYYNSHIRRFTQPDTNLPDPYDPQQLNRYAYVRNNPLKYVDPSGNVIQIPAVLGLYAIAVVNSPDLSIDLNFLSQSVAEFQQLPNVATGLNVAANLASVAIPGESFGPAAKAALKSGGEEVVEQGTKAVARNAEEVYKRIGATGKYGEQMLENAIQGGKQYFKVPGFKGGRIVDLYSSTGEVANEAKTGYQTLTKSLQKQIEKDKTLLSDPFTPIKESVWHFFTSPITGKGGPSKPLEDALINGGITVKKWF